MNLSKHYPGKALLFGEYTILLGSPALAVPIPTLYGQWLYRDVVDERLVQWMEGLETKRLPCLDLKRFENELRKGLYFESNIPLGYGAGSSGALTAALFDQFGLRFDRLDIDVQRGYLAEAESIFHGKSSGLDPLVSYLNRGVFFQQKSGPVLAQLPKSSLHFYLHDSGQSRTTQLLVSIFMNRLKTEPGFQDHMFLLAEMNEAAINAWLSNDFITLWALSYEISKLQLNAMPWLFPDSVRELALLGLQSEEYILKLSGAGGGGYFLIISKEKLSHSFEYFSHYLFFL
jgi:mevalonate kinase